MADPVKLWRYRVPSINGEGYATVVLGSDGYFSAVSDWGNYAFRWTATGCADFRDFVMRALVSPAYWINKLGGPDIFDGEATEAEVKAWVADLDHFASAQQRDVELELLETSDFSCLEGFHRWQERTGIDDSWEFHHEKTDPQATAFVTRAMPRICALIEAELAAERAPAPATEVACG